MKTNKKKIAKTDFGYYEKRLCILMMLSTITNSISTFQFLVTQYTPTFHCDVGNTYNKTEINVSTAEFLNLTIPYVKDGDGKLVRSSCTYYNLLSNGSIANFSKNNVSKCSNFNFDGPKLTATMELKMVCDQAYLDPLMPSLLMAGKLVGALIGGVVSDRFGRRPCFLIFTLYQHVLTIIQSFTSEPISFAIIMFLNGFGALVNYMAITVIGMEFLPSRLRHYVLFLNTIGFSIGCMSVPLLGYYIVNWRWYLRIAGMLGVFYIPYYWYIDETPLWLISKNKKEEAKKILIKIAKLNGRNLDIDDTFVYLQSKETDNNLGAINSWIALFKSWSLLYRFLIVSFSWFMTSGVYFSISYGTNYLSGDRFMNMFYASLMELASAFLYVFISSKFEQRNTYIVFMILTAVCVTFSPIIRSWNVRASIIVFMIGKLSVTLVYSVIYLYTGEIFPTTVRHSTLATASLCSRFGGMLAPYLIFIEQNGQESTSTISVGVMALISAVLYFKLPNTKNLTLPKTILEAKQMKKGVFLTCGDKKNSPDGSSDDSEENNSVFAF